MSPKDSPRLIDVDEDDFCRGRRATND
jgi:hypothetical protein